MAALRQYISEHRSLAALVIAAALLMRLLVPAGFMPMVSADGIRIELCSGYTALPMTDAMPGMAHHAPDDRHHGKMQIPCPYAALVAPALSATDPILLALALAFIVATSLFLAYRVRLVPRAYLRPPLRAPPTA